MAHNLSPAKAARLRQAEKLADWRGFLIYVRCGGPGAHRMVAPIAVDDLLARPRPLETFGQVAGRLRCRVCGSGIDGMMVKKSTASREGTVIIYPRGMEPQPEICERDRIEWWQRYR